MIVSSTTGIRPSFWKQSEFVRGTPAARIEARTVVWAVGVAASPAGHWIGAECDSVGRIKVDPNLAVPASVRQRIQN